MQNTFLLKLSFLHTDIFEAFIFQGCFSLAPKVALVVVVGLAWCCGYCTGMAMLSTPRGVLWSCEVLDNLLFSWCKSEASPLCRLPPLETTFGQGCHAQTLCLSRAGLEDALSLYCRHCTGCCEWPGGVLLLGEEGRWLVRGACQWLEARSLFAVFTSLRTGDLSWLFLGLLRYSNKALRSSIVL